MAKIIPETQTQCYHCGEDCANSNLVVQEKHFCCQGCKSVYEILNKHGLCTYYSISENPGMHQQVPVRADKFAFLDNTAIAHSLLHFTDEQQSHMTCYLPQMHCSSCLWLLENLHKLNKGILRSKVNFTTKEVDIVFEHATISLRQLAELLTAIGYEPYISLHDTTKAKPSIDKSKIYKLGVAGFCFANIMLLSFPEYLGIDVQEQNLVMLFRYLNLFLALPVFFYAASEFYISAYKSLKHGFLNIDAPIVLSIIVTFLRSIYEIWNNIGVGYFDSMSGIVFFMLIGRVLQDKTYAALSFERDYTAYFPVAVTKVNNTEATPIALQDIQLDDTLLIHHQELIPADGILTKGKALIDYSFVTGESLPVVKEMGEIVYAGGRQMGSNIEILVIKEVTQSYLTKLWNNADGNTNASDTSHSFVHLIARYFTWFVFAIAFTAAAYWIWTDAHKALNALTAVLIVACPCALLLSNTFTNGNILSILSNNQFYLRNAQTIEAIAAINQIVFDKTGTLTTSQYENISYEGKPLSSTLKNKIASLAAQSNHPLSKAITQWCKPTKRYAVMAYQELPGQGIEGLVAGDLLLIGSHAFMKNTEEETTNQSRVYVLFEGKLMGCFIFKNTYRANMPNTLQALQKHYTITVLSGDNEGEKNYLQQLLGKAAPLHFKQTPAQKLAYVQNLQNQGHKVMMLGDGLNDAGALKEASVGIAVTENSNNFTPASNAIIEAAQLPMLPKFIALCRFNKTIVITAFVVSILYNLVGIFFAVQGSLQPVVAAILMPCSSISILLLTFGLSNYKAWQLGLFKSPT